eukprot:3614266-Pyramimonas_sp.AAC.2
MIGFYGLSHGGPTRLDPSQVTGVPRCRVSNCSLEEYHGVHRHWFDLIRERLVTSGAPLPPRPPSLVRPHPGEACHL